MRGLAAEGRGDWPGAELLAHEALATVREVRFDGSKQSALVFAWNAHIASRKGDLAARATRLRSLLTYSVPVTSVLALLELARAHMALGDAGGARATLRQIHEIHRHRPDLGTLSRQADELGATLDALQGEMLGVSSLTGAERRVLALLPTHLSFAEIGERLFVSRHTIKTHVHSIYRKLGASSRGETVTRMDELGLHNPA